MFWTLIRLRARLRWYDWTRGPRPRRRIVALVFGGIALTVGVGLAYVVSRFLVTYLVDQGEPVAPVLAMPFAAIFLLMVIGGIASALHRLYFASDLDFLLAAPVPLPLLYLVVLAENVAVEFAPLALALAALVGIGQALDASFLYYLVAPVLLLLIGVIASGINLVLLMLVTRLVPAGRLQGLLRFAGALLGAGLWLAVQLADSRGAVGSGGGFNTPDTALAPLPSTTAAYALVALAGDDPSGAALDVLLLLALSGVLTVTGYLLFDYTFLVNQGRMHEQTGRRRAPPAMPESAEVTPHGATAGTGARRGPAVLVAALAIARKDWRTARRDPRVISSMIFPLVVGGFFAFRFGRDGSAEQAIWVGLVAVPAILLFAAPRLPALVFGGEGTGFAVLRLAPVPIAVVLAGKWLALAAPGLALTLLATVVVTLLSDAGLLILPLIGTALWYTVGGTAAMIGAAAIAPRFRSDDPRASAGCLGQIIGMLITTFFLAASAGVFAWIALLARGEGPADDLVAFGASLALMVLLVAAVAAVGQLLVVGAHRLAAWEEGDT